MNVARDVRERLIEVEELLPPGHEVVVLFDQSRFIRQAVSEVRS